MWETPPPPRIASARGRHAALRYGSSRTRSGRDAFERLPLLGGDLELLAQADDRVALGGLVAVLLRAIDLRVADVVARHAVGLDVEEHGAAAGAHVLHRLARLLVDLLDVLAI